VPPENIHIFRFERLAQDGRCALAGDAGPAAEALSQALGVWRGPALADVLTGELLSAQVTRLEESRMATLELRIEADLRLGRHAPLISELSGLAASHPLHEGFHAKLMLALYRSSRRAESLATYQNLRNVLIDELGLEPSAPMRKLQQAILSADPSLDSAVANGAGSRPRLPQPAQLPPDTPDLVGHGDVVGRAEDLIRTARKSGKAVPVIVLTGMPGVGKTVTAVHLAHRVAAQFPGSQFFAELGSMTEDPASAASALGAFLRSAGVPEIPLGLSERTTLWRSWCSTRDVLLVLDDAASVQQVLPLLPGSPRCTVIITSRFGLRGLANAHVCEIAPLTVGDSVQLLAGIIGSQRLDAELAAAEDIVRLCGQLPLALRSVGARIATIGGWSLGKFARHLADSPRRFDEMESADLSLRARLDSSYSRLSGKEQRTLRLASMLPVASFASGHISGILGCAAEATDHTLLRLVEHHFLTILRDDLPVEEARYAFHEFTRVYVRELLAADLTQQDLTEVGA